MAIVEGELGSQIPSIVIPGNVPEEVVPPSEYTSWEPVIHLDQTLETSEENRQLKLRKVLGTVALIGKVTAKRTAKMAAVGAVTAVAGLAWLGWPVDAGPSHGVATLTSDGQGTIEAAQNNGNNNDPFISFGLNTPLGIGAHARFENVPFRITKDGVVLKDMDPEERKAYTDIGTNYDQLLEDAENNGMDYAFLYFMIGAGAEFTRQVRRDELRKRGHEASPHREKYFRIALAASVVYAGVGSGAANEAASRPTVSLNSLYQGAPGNISIGGEFINMINENRRYFDHLSQEQKAALKDLSPLFKDKDVITIAAYEGSHCATPVVRLFSEAVDELHPSLLVGAGDSAQGNSPLDQYCSTYNVNQLKGHKEVDVLGNHDLLEPITSKWTRYLKSHPIEEKGVRFNGDSDPYRTQTPSHKLKKVGKEDRPAAAQRLGNVTCEDQKNNPKGPSAFISNEPRLNEKVLRERCANLVFAGSIKAGFKVYPSKNGATIEFLLPSIGGTDPDQKETSSLSTKLPNPGGFMYIGLNKVTGDVFFQRVIYAPGGTEKVQLGGLEYISRVFEPSSSS